MQFGGRGTKDAGGIKGQAKVPLRIAFPHEKGPQVEKLSFHRIYTPVEIARTWYSALMTTAIQLGREREEQNLWDKFLDRVKSRISINTFTTWFQPTRLSRVEGDVLHVQIPTTVFRQVLTRTYGEIVKAVFHELGVPNTRVQYVCTEEEPIAASPAVANSGIKQSKLDFESSDHQLNSRYTFDTFVVGKSNEFAHAASRAVAEQPSKAYNPLFLYGGVGMGKTHLMHAIGHLIKQRNPAARLSYVSAEKFTIEVINSLRFDKMFSFRERFHTVDVLLVDDIQFIAGKERTQEEFFHTFNALYEQHKQIVISSDCLPKDINSIEERLRSRFEWGLIADIQPPDLETKIAILQKKAENDRFPLPDEVAEYIARAIKSNVRELEGALTRLMAYASLTGAAISLATAQQVLRNIIASQEKRVTIDLIQKRVSEHFNLREQDLKVRSNTRAIAFPRQVAMYIVKQLTTASLPEIGRQFGGKHHTTVLHSINKIEEMRRSDKDLNRTITRLMDALQ
jgi:chromosomal replication initiator protein